VERCLLLRGDDVLDVFENTRVCKYFDLCGARAMRSAGC